LRPAYRPLDPEGIVGGLRNRTSRDGAKPEPRRHGASATPGRTWDERLGSGPPGVTEFNWLGLESLPNPTLDFKGHFE
jgi:hypothetical protein